MDKWAVRGIVAMVRPEPSAVVRAVLSGPARNRKPCASGNDGTIIFEAPSEDAVKAWHAPGLDHEGGNKGEPKQQARDAFGACLRDPDGNRLGAPTAG